LVTFHNTLRGCEDGNAESWRIFLSDYTPIILQLAVIYVPDSTRLGEQVWHEVLQTLTGDGFSRLRALEHRAEREFLLDLRGLFLEAAAPKQDGADDLASAPRPTLRAVVELLKGLPLLHQQVLFAKLAGYSDGGIERIYNVTPAVAAQSLERLQTDYAALLRRDQDVCPWPAAWIGVLRDARAAKTDSCSRVREQVRMLDGQSSWYEKELLEQHMVSCIHCLESWAALREIVYWRREAKPRSRDEINHLLSGLRIANDSSTRTPLLKRLLGLAAK
jgi:hypothetical protein